MPIYRFKTPATVYFSITAPDECAARAWACSWQEHAATWEQFATAEDVGAALDVPTGITIDETAIAYVETEGDPVLVYAEED
jgi:hypothetical protein